MGAFYGSILVKTDDFSSVKTVLERLADETKKKFFLGPSINDWAAVFPEDSGQDSEVSRKIAELLPNDIIHLIVHDDDVFYYFFYRAGQLIDQYCSNPDNFGEVSEEEKSQMRGRPELLQELLVEPGSLEKLKRLMSVETTFTFEQERLDRFSWLLGLRNTASSYDYLESGEREEIEGWRKFIHIPDLGGEKAAKKAARAQIAAEKKRLRKDGFFLAEMKPPTRRGPSLEPPLVWAIEASGNGVIFLKRTDSIDGSVTGIFAIQPPWDSAPIPTGFEVNRDAYSLFPSPSGRLLAGALGIGGFRAQIWDWKRKELAFEIAPSQGLAWAGFSPDEQRVYTLGGEELIISSLAEKRPVAAVQGLRGSRTAAIHPSGKHAVVSFQQVLAIIDLETKKLAGKRFIFAKMGESDRFPGLPDDVFIRPILQREDYRDYTGIESKQFSAILDNPHALEQLSNESWQKLASLVKRLRSTTDGPEEGPFDILFSPSGRQLLVATDCGVRVYDWHKFLSADREAPPPDFSFDTPKVEEEGRLDSNIVYSLAYDPSRSVIIAGDMTGTIRFLNITNGRSGILLQLPERLIILRIGLTADLKALCFSGGPRAKHTLVEKPVLQIWNYPALCKLAGLD